MAETSSNAYLALYGTQQTDNAQITADWLVDLGFTFESACAVLGNMTAESTINPGIYQNLSWGSTSLGFGLVQWTPSTKYINWAEQNNYIGYNRFGRIAPQCMRIKWELENNQQWSTVGTPYTMSFREFSLSTLSPAYLADVFIKCYERPANSNQPIRGTHAIHWYTVLNGEGGGIFPPDPNNPTGRKKGKIWQWLFP